jgi:general secretion pathway protein E
MSAVQDLLLREGVVSRADLDEARAIQAAFGGEIGATLVRTGALSEDKLLSVYAGATGLPVIGASAMPPVEAISAALALLDIPLSWFADHDALPWVDETGDAAVLHVAGPHVFDAHMAEAVAHSFVGSSMFHLAPLRLVEDRLAALAGGAATETTARSPERLRELAEEAPVIDLVQAMFGDAVSRLASDVHVEPFENATQVRFRIDGILVPWRTLPRAIFGPVSSRIKLLSGMDIGERRLPQDGRQSIRVSGVEMDLRVSSLPTAWGESLVLRFLGKTRALPTLAELGVCDDDIGRLNAMIARPNGLVLVTGPTGSGKTTTVYRLLTHLNDGQRKILTVEDPVELDLPGVVQMAVRADIGMDFAAGLRSILRQDPDIIFVGEIRDAETARIAIQAALTGHLVISTVHTSSAVGAVVRLLDLGIESFLLGEVLCGLVAQRLLRRCCTTCDGGGCTECSGSGYRGRLGIFEAIGAGPALRSAIRAGADQDALALAARADGSRALIDDARDKVALGVTTAAEAARVMGC